MSKVMPEKPPRKFTWRYKQGPRILWTFEAAYGFECTCEGDGPRKTYMWSFRYVCGASEYPPVQGAEQNPDCLMNGRSLVATSTRIPVLADFLCLPSNLVKVFRAAAKEAVPW